MKALLDGDMLLYMVTLANEKEVIFSNDFHVLYADFDECREAYTRHLNDLLKDAEMDDYLVFFSSRENWRKDILPEYKEHRKGSRRPMCFGRLKDWALADDKARMIEWLEADDLIGMEATSSDEPTTIISHDKDFKTVPGRFLRYRQGAGFVDDITVDSEQARYWHMIQTLMGDRVDGYFGCPGVGEKTAPKLLDKMVETPGRITKDEFPAVWEQIIAQFEKAKSTAEDALVNAQVARILHHGDYSGDFVRYWQPEYT